MRKTVALSIVMAILLCGLSSGVIVVDKKEAKKIAGLKKQEVKLQKKIIKEEKESLPEPEGLPRLSPVKPLSPSVGKPLPLARGIKTIMAEKERKRAPYPLQLGISIGLFANTPSACLELMWNHPLDLDFASIKTGVMYAQGKDGAGTERKHALVFADGIWRLNQPGTDGVGMYLGGGLNYLAMTSGRVLGTAGAEIYIGFDSKTSRSEFIYAELGYGAIRTGFSPTYKGLNAIVGLRTRV